MRWVDGPSLRQILDDRRTLELEEVRALGAQLGGALDAAAAQWLVHLDVKPENVLFAPVADTERAYLSDFGAGELAAWKAGADRSRTFQGTADYAAPEQIEGADVDRRTSVYALGCLLYETLTGAPPFAGPSRKAVLRGHLRDAPPPIGAEPTDLDRVFAKALAKDPEERYATCLEFAEALRGELAFRPRPLSRSRARRVVSVRHAAIAASVALVAGGGAAAAFSFTRDAPGTSSPRTESVDSRGELLASRETAGSIAERARRPQRAAPSEKRASANKAQRHAPQSRAAATAKAAKRMRDRVARKTVAPETRVAATATAELSASASRRSVISEPSAATPAAGAQTSSSRAATTTRPASPPPPPLPPPPPPEPQPPPPPPPPPP
jgi:serine/threonine protein kinase